MSDDDEHKLGGLTDEEREALKDKFNLIDDDMPSLERIEKQFDATRERIRKIEEAALKKLKGHKNTDTDKIFSCSFCNRPKNKVKRLIASNFGVTICGECVAICVNLLDERNGN